MKRILINAEQPNEVRVAYVEDNKLVDFEIESNVQDSVKGNIYIGVVNAVKTDLEGAFVDIGEERQGLLAFNKAGGRSSRDPRTQSGDASVQIEHPNLEVGQKLLVQIFRDARGEKGSALTTELSLPGRFIVLKPNSNVRAVTRNVPEAQRIRLRELGNRLPNVENVGWIMRTTTANHTLEEITSDFHRLMNVWRNIQKAFEENKENAPLLVFSDNTLMQRVLRDRLRRDGTKVIVDDASLYRESRNYASDFMPELRDQIEHYRGDRPIFDTFRVENAVTSLFARKVRLPSGGELVFDPTEALLSIDVNSARNTGGDNLEATALHTNLEAAEELCRQLKIRNIGGLVIVDFIDMLTEGYNEQVEDVVRKHLAKDAANAECSVISEFGLMQINRQRRRSSIYDTHFKECEHCLGSRFVQRTETSANQILRKLSYLIHDPTRPDNQYLCRVQEDVASYILNKERQYLRDLELNTRKQVIIVADPTIIDGSYDIQSRRVKGVDYEGGSNLEELLEETREELAKAQRVDFPEEPRVSAKPLVSPVSKKPKKKQQKNVSKGSTSNKKKHGKGKQKRGVFSRMFDSLFGTKKGSSKSKQSSRTAQNQRQKQSKRRDSSTTRTPQRDRATGERSQSNRNRNDPRRNTRPARRGDRPQQDSRSANAPARAPRRERSGNQSRTSRDESNASNANRRRASNNNVRRAEDLRTTDDTEAPRRAQDSTAPAQNRRAPRTNRGPSPSSNEAAERSQSQRSSEQRSERRTGASQGEAQPSRRAAPKDRTASHQRSRQPDREASNDQQRPQEVDAKTEPKRTQDESVSRTESRPAKNEQNQEVKPLRVSPDETSESPRKYAANDPRSRTAEAPSKPEAENVAASASAPQPTTNTPEVQDSVAQAPAVEPTTQPVQASAPAEPQASGIEAKSDAPSAEVTADPVEATPSRASNDPRHRLETEA